MVYNKIPNKIVKKDFYYSKVLKRSFLTTLRGFCKKRLANQGFNHSFFFYKVNDFDEKSQVEGYSTTFFD